jgi:glycosyltransferase involved in cell wall biosynthesis
MPYRSINSWWLTAMDTQSLYGVTRETAAWSATAGTPRRRLRIGVLVSLVRHRGAGGHVKCWERLARAALDHADEIDLTVHFLDDERRETMLGDNVRFVTERPIFSTARLGFLSHVPDHTDLAPWHPSLARALAGYDLIHTTDAFFAFSRTAMRVAKRNDIPVVNSVHTNTPEYAGFFTARTIARVFGDGRTTALLRDRIAVPDMIRWQMQRQLRRHQQGCDFSLVSRPDQLESALDLTGGRAGLLRRGVDHTAFKPGVADRAWLEQRHGIPGDRFVVVFVGRLNLGKNVLVLAEALAALVARGEKVHLICAGEGDLRPTILSALGGNVTCTGVVDADELARLYAAADIFGFPSLIEECANVVLEATASGLPSLVAAEGGMARAIRDGETGLALPAADPAAWASAIARLASDRPSLTAMKRAARRYAVNHLPSWSDVLDEDLLPRWQAVVEHRRRAAL